MPNIKKLIVKYLYRITFIMVMVILVIATVVQILNEQRQAKESSGLMFYEIEQILAENHKELARIQAEYSQTCLHNAETIAYIIQEQPSILESVDELKRIAEFVEVDEIHIFDKTGTIFMGTHPEYFGYSFDSGEQIGFFKPMLEDKALKLCQDISPNTAEGRMMQYSALWSEKGEFIVQVGMAPVNVLKLTEKNEISYTFSLLEVNVGVDFYAIDAESGEIVGATDADAVGKNMTEIGIYPDRIKFKTEQRDGFHANVKGENSYCIFTIMDGNYIGRVVAADVLYHSIPISVLWLAICLVCIAIILVWAVSGYVNKYVISNIYDINEKLHAITNGNLDEKVDVQSSLEFSELSSHINEMIKSLLSSTEKISCVLNRTNMHIGVYEYNENMKAVRFTEYVPKILALNPDREEQIFADYRFFRDYLDKLRANPVYDEENVFSLEGKVERYVKLEEIIQNNNHMGIVMDVTEEILKRRQIEAERDIDLLTGLYNRRGLENKLSALFENPEALGYGALILIDADGLKEINDEYGHDKGDLYIKKISRIIETFGLKSSLSARLGGDEFVLFLYKYDNETELERSIQTLQYIQNNGTVYLGEDRSVPLRFSFGVSMTKGETDYKSLLKQADERMYVSKRERKKEQERKKELEV